MVMNRKDAMVTGCRSVDVFSFFSIIEFNCIYDLLSRAEAEDHTRGARLLLLFYFPLSPFSCVYATYDDASPPTSARLPQHWPRVRWAPPFSSSEEGGGL